MRHKKSFNHLSRTTSHRKAMLANMAASLILHKRIKTTTAKAKALRIFVEPLLTKSKDDSTHSRRVVFSYIQDKDAVSELFREVSPKISDRPGGYTRILKTGSRSGDNADMCIIELVDYNENLLISKEDAQAKSGRRRRRGGKKKADGEVAVEQTDVASVESKEEEKSEDVKAEEVVEAKLDEEKKEEVETEVAEAKEAIVEEKVEKEVVEEKVEEKEIKAQDSAESDAQAENEKKDNSGEEKSEEDKK